MTHRSNDRRRAPRAETLLTVQYESLGGAEGAKTVDASRSGLFVSTKKPLPVGTVLSLRLEDGPTLKVRVARIVEADPASNRTSGMGLAVLEGAEALASYGGNSKASSARRSAPMRASWVPPVPALRAFEESSTRAAPASAKAPSANAEAASEPKAEAAARGDEGAKKGNKKKKGKGGRGDLLAREP